MKNDVNKTKGIFVAIEGIDGTGKTTLANSLKKILEDDYSIYLTHEPSNSEAGLKLRKSFTEGRLSPEEEAKLFVEDRKIHIKDEILPHLNSGFIVITDRYYFSNIAYQGAVGVPTSVLKSMNSEFILPNLVLYLDLDVDEALSRITKNRGCPDLMERREDIVKIKSIYENLALEYSDIFVRIDVSKSIEEVAINSKKEILKKMSQGRYHKTSNEYGRCLNFL